MTRRLEKLHASGDAMTMRFPPALLFLLAVLGVVCSGCQTSLKQEFHKDDPARVWAAMKGAEEAQNYEGGDYTDRWTVRDNQVQVFEDEARIEVFRRLERVLYRPLAKPLPETREWTLTMHLEENDAHEPIVVFLNRKNAIPARVRDEAERYFRDVSELLGRTYSATQPDRPPHKSVVHMEQFGQPSVRSRELTQDESAPE
ncbi:MAG TPA: hypothetical protein VG711_05080 [Phycisphaerales bacterium]|nr:hypothetical protein [Phycisphaerales bacterium]